MEKGPGATKGKGPVSTSGIFQAVDLSCALRAHLVSSLNHCPKMAKTKHLKMTERGEYVVDSKEGFRYCKQQNKKHIKCQMAHIKNL